MHDESIKTINTIDVCVYRPRSWACLGHNLPVNGLYDGEFVGYKISSSEEINAALREGIVAVDANVLLDLYRFRPHTSRDLIKIFKTLGVRLVVPHQALREFWRRRWRSLDSPGGATKVATDALDKSRRSIGDALKTWTQAVGADDDEFAELKARVGDFFDALSGELQLVLQEADREQGEDPILEQLEVILVGKVTLPLEDAEWSDCVAEGNRRVGAKQPPGHEDAEKLDSGLPEGAAGDYLVWYQATRCAKEQDRDLVIVTSERKEDWWWRRQGNFIGARPELTLEYHDLTGRRLFLMRPTDLLGRAKAALGVAVDQASPIDAERLADSETMHDEAADNEEDRPREPWTLDALGFLIDRLDQEAPVQAAALRLATPDQDGRVSRQKVYELGHYSDDRMLRGFTKPFRRLTAALQAEGAVPAGVSPIFVARYPDGVRTSYFSVPSEVPSLLEELSRKGPRPDGEAS